MQTLEIQTFSTDYYGKISHLTEPQNWGFKKEDNFNCTKF